MSSRNTGCVRTCSSNRGPAPSAQFVQQAQRLHDGALASSVTTDAGLREYVQLVGKRVGDAARALDPGRTRDPLFSEIEYHLVACAVPNVVTTGGSTIKAIERVREEGHTVVGVVAILDRLAGGADPIRAAAGGAPYVALTTIDDVYPGRPDRAQTG